MTQSEGKLTGGERDAALDDLRASLDIFGDEPSTPRSEADVLSVLAQHPEHEKYFEVYAKLFSLITLDKDVFVNNPYSPTPGDPERVYVGDVKYGESAERYMYDKLKAAQSSLYKSYDENKQTSVLKTDEVNTMRHEISFQHESEIEKNTAAFDRLRAKFMNDPSSISVEEADLIERVRGVDAVIAEQLNLLTRHPEMDSVGVMKITCAMDFSAYYDSHSEFRSRLADLNNIDRFVATLVGTDDQEPRPRDLKDSAPKEVRADKTVVAEIFDSETGLVIEAVEKTSWYAFDASRSFKPFIPHIVDGINVQPTYTQIYIRIKRNRSNEDELHEQQREYDARQMFIITNGIKRHIEDL